MKNHNGLTILSFEAKVKLLNEAEKICTAERIDQLMTERHRRQQSTMPNDREKLSFLKEDS